MIRSLLLGFSILLIFNSCSNDDIKKVIDDTQAEIDESIELYEGDQPIVIEDNEVSVNVEGDRLELLNIHNNLRYEVGVSRTLSWSQELEQKAQDYADTLALSGKFEHDTNNNTGDFATSTGENLYASSSSTITFQDAAKAWGDEKIFYHYGEVGDSSTCDDGKVCGHYTQMIWQYTTKIGCAKSQYTQGKFEGGYIIVCKYQSPGNVIGYKPY